MVEAAILFGVKFDMEKGAKTCPACVLTYGSVPGGGGGTQVQRGAAP